MENTNIRRANYFVRVISSFIDLTIVYFIVLIYVVMMLALSITDMEALANKTLSDEETQKIILVFISGGGVHILYFAILEALFGSTLGKLICGLKVVDKEYRRINFGIALARAIFNLISYFLVSLLIGIFMLLPMYGRGRTLTDIICGTNVIRR